MSDETTTEPAVIRIAEGLHWVGEDEQRRIAEGVPDGGKISDDGGGER